MLKKLASFAFWEVWLISFLMKDIPSVDRVFSKVESFGHLGELMSVIPNHEQLNLTGFAIALCVAGLSYAAQLHDKISDLFRIRCRFDCKYILIPLADSVGATLSVVQVSKLSAQRDRLMREVYYRFASSRAQNPLVDKHYIEHALGAWSWFWILIEAMLFFGVSALLADRLGDSRLSLCFTFVFCMSLFLAYLQYPRLVRLSEAQIGSIASDVAASAEVRKVFGAL
jgi:hypothetical protein